MYMQIPVVLCFICSSRVSFRIFGKGVGLELKRGGMLAALARPLEGGLRFQWGANAPAPPRRNSVFYILHSFPVVLCSGSDGLVKIWTVKTSECVATLDLHTEKARLRPPYCPCNSLQYTYIYTFMYTVGVVCSEH